MNSKRPALKRFLIRLGLFLLVQLAVGLFLHQFSSTESSNHYLASMQDKMDRLRSGRDARVVILGGSNTVFGIHSDIIQNATQMSVVNLGLHVSLGLEFPIRCYLPHARRGDIVVLSPEYHVLMKESDQLGDPAVANQLIEQWGEARTYLPRAADTSWKKFFDHDSVLLAHQWVHRSIKMIRGRDKIDKVYRRSSFNEYGDLVAHREKVAPSLTPMAALATPSVATLERTAETLNTFVKQCEVRGVSVYLCYPPFAKSTFEESWGAISETEQYIKSQCKIHCLNRPQDNVYHDDCFFDSSYHLNGTTGLKQSLEIARLITEHSGISIENVANTRSSESDALLPPSVATWQSINGDRGSSRSSKR